MSSDDEYYVPVKVKDEFLLFVAEKTTGFLKRNSRLERIFQKYNEAYNTTFKESFSVKTLQVMNQNHKTIFSSITPSGRIKSPRCSSVSSKKEANQQFRTPLKRNRISLSTEWKRLSFDDAAEKDTELPQAFKQICDDFQLFVTSPIKKNRTPDRLISDERKAIAYLDASPPLFSYGEEKNTSDSPNMCIPERFSLNGKPETITSLSIYDSDTEDTLYKTPDSEISLSFLISEREVKASVNPNAHIQEMFSLEKKPDTISSFASHDKDTPCLSTKTPDKQETLVTSCDKNLTPVNNTADDRRSVKRLVISPSLLKAEEQNKVSNEPNTNDQEGFRPGEKPKITFALSTEHKEAIKSETSPILSIVDAEAISKSYKTPDKCKITMPASVNRKERTSLNPIVAKRVIVKTASNENEFFSPLTDIKTNNPKVNKRKSVDCSEDDVINTSLVAEDEVCVGRPKIAKLDDGLAEDDKKTIDPADDFSMDVKNSLNPLDNSAMDDKESLSPDDGSAMDEKKSLNPADGSAMDENESLNPVDDSAMDDKESFNRLDDSAKDDTISFNPIDNSAMDSKVYLNLDDDSAADEKESFNPADDSAMDEKDSFNHVDNCATDDKKSFNNIDIMDDMSTVPPNVPPDMNAIKSASQIEKSERTANVSAYCQTSETLTCASRFSPKGDQKITVEDNSDISSSKKNQIRINSNVTHETTDVESLTTLMQNLSPSVKRSFNGSSQKSTNRSVSDDTSFARQLCLQDNLSKTATPPKNFLVSNVSSPKLDDICMIKTEKFCKKLIQSKKRLSNYHCLFLEDKDDLRFIYDYLRSMTAVVEIIPIKAYNAELTEYVEVFTDKASKLLDKTTSWQFDVEKDIFVCDDCLKKTSEIQQEIQRICEDKTHDLTPNNFLRWEACLRVTNKKANDMILLRDIRRPTILQFGHELENLIQLLIRCLLVLGLIKPCSKVSSD